MNRPDNIFLYDEMDLKLGIKSSLPHVKSTLALAVLLWECADRPAELVYSAQHGDETVLTQELEQWVIDYLSEICTEEEIDYDSLIEKINSNQLFKSQMEALIVAFELVWKLAKVSFVEVDKAASAERTGGIRYPKKLMYSANADIIHSVIESHHDAYIRVLMSWIGLNVNTDPECETILTGLLTVLSENAVFKMADGSRAVVFNQNGLYRKALETGQPVDINGDDEAKGSLRILKSLLSDGMNPYLQYSNGSVTAMERRTGDLEAYQKRVDTFLRLSATKVVGLEDPEADGGGLEQDNLEDIRVSGGTNVLLYGVPGAGKSWTIAHEYCDDESRMERLVFHPDYTYSDFIGQILPNVSEGIVSYSFTPGPFTALLKKAYLNPDTEYFLVIEEINRGNAPAIFGEVFQLLDRKTEISETDDDGYPIGTSEYGITNVNIAKIVYGNPSHKVRIPSNMSIIGTMNTSDQNVFTLDTAFQRRWDMRMIENSFKDVNPTFANHVILDTEVTWRVFCTAINDIILEKNIRLTSSEDKRLGTYFVHLRDLIYDEKADDEQLGAFERAKARRNNSRFPEKVLKYLWDDAFKFSREDVFDVSRYNSLEAVIRQFAQEKGNARFSVFKDTVYDALVHPDVQND